MRNEEQQIFPNSGFVDWRSNSAEPESGSENPHKNTRTKRSNDEQAKESFDPNRSGINDVDGGSFYSSSCSGYHPALDRLYTWFWPGTGRKIANIG